MSTDDLYARMRPLKMLIFDVDGVLTDGSLFFGDDGQEYKAFNSLDGHGIKMLRDSGVEAAIITGRTSQVVLHRAKNLGIERIFQGAGDKLESFRVLLRETGLQPAQTGYMGDDIVDLPVLKRSGLAVTVPTAPALVRNQVHYVTHAQAGRGAAREVCELIMQAQGTWAEQLAHYDR
ncbi:MAG TPA: HAD hydrolase family protein [Thiobacillaceae bacterium]|nr:HAD hydrolase family protein [Thiobacillaceae bacterium]